MNHHFEAGPSNSSGGNLEAEEGSEEDEKPSTSGATKRRKNRVSKVKSCAECRRLKLKCDRRVPCENCLKRGTGSICPDGALKTARGRTLILESNEHLHDRIAQLELALHQATSSSGTHPLLKRAYHLDLEDRSPSPQISRDREEYRPTQRTRLNSHGMENDGVPAYGHLNIDASDPRSSNFYGDGASMYLMETKLRIPGEEETRTKTYQFRPGWVESFTFERDSALRAHMTLDLLIQQLPSRSEGGRLSGIFFQNVAWGTAILDEIIFVNDIFDRFYMNREPDSQKLAVLYFVLALGALFDVNVVPGASYNPYTRDLFALGRACLALDSSGSVIFVQAVHLMVTWLLNGGSVVSSTQATWPLLGMAIRVVQALGLHRDGSHYNLPPDEVEERRRVFWEIYAYDVMQALSTGRPRSMMNWAFDVKIPATPEAGDHYHEQRYKLTQHFCKVNDEQARLSPSSYETVLTFDRDIRHLQNELPEQLTSEENILPRRSTNQTHHLQRHTIRFQMNVGLLFLHRGWFARALLDHPEEPLRSRYSPSYVGCLEACKSLVDVVKQLSINTAEIVERRWFFHFHAFSACACLAAAVIRAPGSLVSQSSLAALDEGIKLFEQARKMEEHVSLVRLRDKARKSFENAGQRKPPSNDEEDLALLGKGGNVNRRSSIRHYLPSLPTSSSLTPPLGPSTKSGNTSSTASPVFYNPTSGISPSLTSSIPGIPGGVGTTGPSDTGTDKGTGSQTDGKGTTANSSPNDGFYPSGGYRPPDGLNWGEEGNVVADFDFDSFLANFGIHSDITDLLS